MCVGRRVSRSKYCDYFSAFQESEEEKMDDEQEINYAEANLRRNLVRMPYNRRFGR